MGLSFAGLEGLFKKSPETSGEIRRRNTPALGALVLNVPALVHKSINDVARVLGMPSKRVETVKGHPKHSYVGGTVEIVFVEGHAAWIELRDCRDLPFAPDALAKLGLKPSKPTLADRSVLRWTNLYRIKEVTLRAGPHGNCSRLTVDAGFISRMAVVEVSASR